MPINRLPVSPLLRPVLQLTTQAEAMTTAQDATEVLRNATFSHSEGHTPSVTAADLFRSEGSLTGGH